MTARKIKTKSVAVAGAPSEGASLKFFYDGAGPHPGFRFQRAWWDGEGPRAGIAERVRKKLRPGDDPDYGSALRHDVLLPRSAPSEYMDVDHLIARYDATLPRFGFHAYAQISIDLDPDEPLHIGWERVRSYARSFTESGLAVVLVLHAPPLALSSNHHHCHLMVPGRFLTAHGFGAAATLLCSDVGHRDAWQAWQSHLAESKRALAKGDAA